VVKNDAKTLNRLVARAKRWPHKITSEETVLLATALEAFMAVHNVKPRPVVLDVVIGSVPHQIRITPMER
jgi:hypothetical protein